MIILELIAIVVVAVFTVNFFARMPLSFIKYLIPIICGLFALACGLSHKLCSDGASMIASLNCASLFSFMLIFVATTILTLLMCIGIDIDNRRILRDGDKANKLSVVMEVIVGVIIMVISAVVLLVTQK